jgi:FMN phosphatase YigB (HAD superfamily)
MYERDCSDEEREVETKNMAYHIIRELTELVDETNWKRHVKFRKTINKSNILEEYVDVFKFFINLGLRWGITDDDLVKEFERKSTVVEQKWDQECWLDQLKQDDKIVGVDIDGVLAPYPEHFLKWAIEWDWRVACEAGDPPNGFPVYSSIKEFIEKRGYGTYVEAKHAYRSTGQKRFLPVIDGAKELLHELHVRGYKIILLSARPYQKYVRIFADTIEWLNSNGLEYDAIMFDRDKEDTIIKRFPNIKLMIDDDEANIRKICQAGFRYCWIQSGGAFPMFKSDGCIVNSVKEAYERIDECLSERKE